MSDRITGSMSPQVEQQKAVDYLNGVTEEVLDTKVGNALPPQIAPLADSQSLELIGANRNLEAMRLASPLATNPFAHSPMGPRQDYLMVSRILNRMGSDSISQSVKEVLLSPPLGQVSEQAISHMRASLAREGNMLSRLKEYLNNAQTVHNRILGSQEG